VIGPMGLIGLMGSKGSTTAKTDVGSRKRQTANGKLLTANC
jgi:hypothetical protein